METIYWGYVVFGLVVLAILFGGETSRRKIVKTTKDWWVTPTFSKKGRRGRRGNQIILSIVGALVTGFAAVGWILVSGGIFGIALGVFAAGGALALLGRAGRLAGAESGNPIYLGEKPEEESDLMDGYF